ncbi:hypothetical protein Ae717Ps2_4168c [Pseudonocardia sp. Ae717_Ps2]|uniref:WXG100 family type VII secretion target n=1 Tax=Pseudonocardia sp. Ae717_Ps2 TaxID=1885573 RepID=UPI00094AB8FD|nr:WXG100 family type VII secretion target [Pseudonocardia sp. Ae717_Ps2]OLM33272.1 hypothetical protein Ae717Ps2_4168c [Pseudonocardia sp. Ae717_Ps2]
MDHIKYEYENISEAVSEMKRTAGAMLEETESLKREVNQLVGAPDDYTGQSASAYDGKAVELSRQLQAKIEHLNELHRMVQQGAEDVQLQDRAGAGRF